MKLETWAPSFLRRIATIWNAEHEDYSKPKTYVYAVLTSGGVPIEVRSPKPLPYGKLLRTEAKE